MNTYGPEHDGGQQRQPDSGASDLLPLMLKVSSRPVLVVGAGPVAHRKVEVFAGAGADVLIVAPELGTDLAAWKELGVPWEWEQREFQEADAVGKMLVVAATASRETNERVAQAAGDAGALVNVVDDPPACDFFVPAVVRRGPLQIAVGTGGTAPGLAAEVRRRLEDVFDERWGRAVELVGRAREEVFASDLSEERRRAVVLGLSGLDIGALLEEGGVTRVERAVQECISRY